MLTQIGLRDSELFYLAAHWIARRPDNYKDLEDFDSALTAPMTQAGAGERMIDLWELYGCPTLFERVSHPNESTRWTQTVSG